MRITDRILIVHLALVWIISAMAWPGLAIAQYENPPEPNVENDRILMFLRLHTPEQMAAFYEARGFPPQAIERLRQTCFVMAHVENRGEKVLWMELKNWRFVTATGELRRLDQDYWKAVWDEIGLPRANRSTFGWTQLPDERDLQPGEPVGGNMILSPTDAPFTLEADFHTGSNKRSGMVSVRFKDLRCAKDEPTK